MRAAATSTIPTATGVRGRRSTSQSDVTKNGETGIPAARYAQWKAVLHAGSSAPGVDSVALNYLPKNVAPEIDDVTVQVGVKYQPLPKMSGIGIGFGSSARFFAEPHFEAPNSQFS